MSGKQKLGPMGLPEPPIRALRLLEESREIDRSVAIGRITKRCREDGHAVVNGLALRALEKRGFARRSSEGGYALITPEGQSAHRIISLVGEDRR